MNKLLVMVILIFVSKFASAQNGNCFSTVEQLEANKHLVPQALTQLPLQLASTPDSARPAFVIIDKKGKKLRAIFRFRIPIGKSKVKDRAVTELCLEPGGFSVTFEAQQGEKNYGKQVIKVNTDGSFAFLDAKMAKASVAAIQKINSDLNSEDKVNETLPASVGGADGSAQ